MLLKKRNKDEKKQGWKKCCLKSLKLIFKINYPVGRDNYDTHKSPKKPLVARCAKRRKVGYSSMNTRLQFRQKVIYLLELNWLKLTDTANHCTCQFFSPPKQKKCTCLVCNTRHATQKNEIDIEIQYLNLYGPLFSQKFFQFSWMNIS